MSTVQLRRNEAKDHNGNKVIEVFIGQEKRGYQWKFVGNWTQEDMDMAETALLGSGETYPYTNHWELYDGTYGNMYRFVAKRYTWEHGPYRHGNTAEELAQSMREYYRRIHELPNDA